MASSRHREKAKNRGSSLPFTPTTYLTTSIGTHFPGHSDTPDLVLRASHEKATRFQRPTRRRQLCKVEGVKSDDLNYYRMEFAGSINR